MQAIGRQDGECKGKLQVGSYIALGTQQITCRPQAAVILWDTAHPMQTTGSSMGPRHDKSHAGNWWLQLASKARRVTSKTDTPQVCSSSLQGAS